ncbi:MAG: hypothetical protein WD733_24895 [Bryobacterales bacterium]
MPDTTPEYEAFTDFMDKLVKVPHSTIKRGITNHRKKSAANPNRPGPKPGRKRATNGASRDSHESV